ncbi:hypothetical protein OR571_13320 [Psychrobacillus sp. NEAU-3TGS]|uniref:hypothetical protein n=1 Tax=Psychrobacillus sp. NEAU-3TGS TaxID=2995412 RepID=UPI0024962E54|nr:hypothetical protein [Psychrobacillus sp. NEAU-3TGS]MDI2588068.1 hypothetical protein [Psychrobacillus sp. NEAU-3TGS]
MNYYLFEDEGHKVNVVYKPAELDEIVVYWNKGYDIKEIAKKMNRKPIEVLLLALDRAEIGKIKRRKHSIFG